MTEATDQVIIMDNHIIKLFRIIHIFFFLRLRDKIKYNHSKSDLSTFAGFTKKNKQGYHKDEKNILKRLEKVSLLSPIILETRYTHKNDLQNQDHKAISINYYQNDLLYDVH